MVPIARWWILGGRVGMVHALLCGAVRLRGIKLAGVFVGFSWFAPQRAHQPFESSARSVCLLPCAELEQPTLQMAAKDPITQALAKVFAHPLKFHCPAAKARLYNVLTGKTPTVAQHGDGIKISTMAGVILIPDLPVTPEETLTQIKGRIAELCPDFPPASMVLYFAPKTAESSSGLKLHELPLRDAEGAEHTMKQLKPLFDTLYIVRMTPHEKKTTTIRNEYERGDIDCPRCKRKGPSRYTGHEKCDVCKCCGSCCIIVDRCGVPLDAPVAEPGTSAEKDALNDRQGAYLAEFYKWQRGIMKPY